MRGNKLFSVCLMIFWFPLMMLAQQSSTINKNDSFTLAQAYINLSLTNQYFDSLPVSRITKIIPYEERELASLKDKKFKRRNKRLYNTSYSLLFVNKAKLLYRTKKEIKRDELVEWKKALGQANKHYKMSLNYGPFVRPDTSLHDLINFNEDSKDSLSRDIEGLKVEFTPYFNNAIYSEFKERFLKAKQDNNYNFLALWNSAATYDLSLEFRILKDAGERPFSLFKPSGHIIYELDLKHDLISRYIQLKYLSSSQFKKTLTNSQINNLFDSYDSFIADLKKEKDPFIVKEINTKVCQALKQELQEKFPYQKILFMIKDEDPTVVSQTMMLKSDTQYFFPNPAPKASADETITNYKPDLTVLGDVDDHLSGILNNAGYINQKHYYYYALDDGTIIGFALTTSLEKFNTDGSKMDDDKRWVNNLGTDVKFSYYEIFKSLFLDIESEFRMYAFIVASEHVEIDTDEFTPGDAERLIKNSYDALPEVLRDKALGTNNLTILVYHFHQNDVGEVPELDLSKNISVLEHLKLAALANLFD